MPGGLCRECSAIAMMVMAQGALSLQRPLMSAYCSDCYV
jgi:hypothetical protein